MANELRTEVEQIKQRDDVKRALKQASAVKPEEKPKAETRDKLLLSTHALIFIALAVLHFVLQFKVFGFAARFIPLIQKLNLSVMAIVLLLAIAKIVDVYLIGGVDDRAARYNLRRIAKLVLVLVLFFIIISILFQNWYTTIVSVGLISLVLGLAVQTPFPRLDLHFGADTISGRRSHQDWRGYRRRDRCQLSRYNPLGIWR